MGGGPSCSPTSPLGQDPRLATRHPGRGTREARPPSHVRCLGSNPPASERPPAPHAEAAASPGAPRATCGPLSRRRSQPRSPLSRVCSPCRKPCVGPGVVQGPTCGDGPRVALGLERSTFATSVLETEPPGHSGGTSGALRGHFGALRGHSGGTSGHFGGASGRFRDTSLRYGYSTDSLERRKREKERSDASVTGSPPCPPFNTLHSPPKCPDCFQGGEGTQDSRGRVNTVSPLALPSSTQGLPRGAAPKAAGTRDALSVFTLRSPCRRRPNFLNSSTLGIDPPFLVLQQGRGFLSHLCTANSCLPMPGSPPRMPRAHGFPRLGPRPARGAGNEAPGNSASRSVPAEAFRFGVRSPSALRSSKP